MYKRFSNDFENNEENKLSIYIYLLNLCIFNLVAKRFVKLAINLCMNI